MYGFRVLFVLQCQFKSCKNEFLSLEINGNGEMTTQFLHAYMYLSSDYATYDERCT